MSDSEKSQKPKPPKSKPKKAAPKAAKKAAGPRVSPEAIDHIFDTLGELTPHPKTELEYVNAYTLLVAVVLAAQATDAGVNRATRKLFETVTTPAAMLELGLEGLREHVKTIGLYNTKAKNIIALSEKLVAEFGGEVPATLEELVSLPGVGRKSANVILHEIFLQPTMPVDTHVFRVAHRIGLSDGKTPIAVEHDLLALVPKRWEMEAHHLLVLHGRYLCKAKRPECWRCPIVNWCLYDKKEMTPPGDRK